MAGICIFFYIFACIGGVMVRVSQGDWVPDKSLSYHENSRRSTARRRDLQPLGSENFGATPNP